MSTGEAAGNSPSLEVTSRSLSLGGIVLCGGRSLRMGEPKFRLRFGHETLLERTVRLLGEAVGPIVVVAATGQELPELPDGIVVVYDPITGRGPLQGLAAGLEALPALVDCVYASATDVPFLQPGWVARLTELIGVNDLAIPEVGGFLHPLASLYRRVPTTQAVDALLAQGQLRLVALAQVLRSVRVHARMMASVDPELATLRNLNTPEDYRLALLEAGLRPSKNKDSGFVKSSGA